MKHFKAIKSLESLKAQYKQLAIANHPDNGGTLEKMQEINAEYDQLFPVWKRKSSVETEETSFSTRSEFYTQNGWKGERYNGSLSTTEISKIIKTYCKEMYPTWKFSVTSEYYSGGSSIHVSVMEAPYYIFNDEAIKNDTCWDIDGDEIHLQLHHFNDRDKKFFVESAYLVMQDVYDFMQSYNYDDSDSMIDYFSTNFYSHFNIGKWNKGFKVVEKTARIKTKKAETKPATTEAAAQEHPEAKQPETTQEMAAYEFTINKDTDTRDQSIIYVVKCTDTLDRAEYLKLNGYIKSIGGYYSKFKHGFIFKEDPTTVLNGNTTQEQTTAEKQETAAEEKLYYTHNTSMKTLEVTGENLQDDTIKKIKSLGFIYLSGIKKYIADYSGENLQLLIENFSSIINNMDDIAS